MHVEIYKCQPPGKVNSTQSVIIHIEQYVVHTIVHNILRTKVHSTRCTNFSDSFLYTSLVLLSLAFRNLSSASLTFRCCDLYQICNSNKQLCFLTEVRTYKLLVKGTGSYTVNQNLKGMWYRLTINCIKVCMYPFMIDWLLICIYLVYCIQLCQSTCDQIMSTGESLLKASPTIHLTSLWASTILKEDNFYITSKLIKNKIVFVK